MMKGFCVRKNLKVELGRELCTVKLFPIFVASLYNIYYFFLQSMNSFLY